MPKVGISVNTTWGIGTMKIILVLVLGQLNIWGKRKWNSDAIEDYLVQVNSGNFSSHNYEELTTEESLRETVIMGLRMVEGISIPRLEERFQINCMDYYGQTLERLIQLKMIEHKGDNIRLTEKGMVLANQVLSELV